MAEYLRYEPDRKKYPEAYLGFEGLIESGKILAPALLGMLLTDAREYLIREPGENKMRREILVPRWLDWWIGLAKNKSPEFASSDGKLADHPNILTPDQMAVRFRASDQLSGIWNMATGEGSEAHRWAWEKSKGNAMLVGLYFEGGKYFDQHPGRRKPCLPEAMRATMAALFGLLVTVAPERPDGTGEAEHYQQIFQASEADINFTTKVNDHYRDILNRNNPKWRHLALIRHLEGHMSEKAKRLASDIDSLPDLRIHSSDNSRRLFELREAEEEALCYRAMTAFGTMERITTR